MTHPLAPARPPLPAGEQGQSRNEGSGKAQVRFFSTIGCSSPGTHRVRKTGLPFQMMRELAVIAVKFEINTDPTWLSGLGGCGPLLPLLASHSLMKRRFAY